VLPIPTALRQLTDQYPPLYVYKSYEVSPTREKCGSRKKEPASVGGVEGPLVESLGHLTEKGQGSLEIELHNLYHGFALWEVAIK
jgi:hypothetical protein